MGPVRFLGSVVSNGQYLLLDAKINGSRIKNRGEIPYKEFPVSNKLMGIKICTINQCNHTSSY